MREHLPNTVSLNWRSSRKEHENFLEWTHGPLYSDSCALCQQGIQLIMKAVAWLDGGVLVERRSIHNQDSRGISTEIYPGVYRTFDAACDKIIIVDFEPEPKEMLDWFVEKYQGQFQSAHVNTLYLTDQNDIVYSKLLDF